tara:strand:- start:1318 stop:1677 length:360 start_codon:yes stop_codon:yes gene_type:complete
MKKISELKEFGYINIFGTFLISFFFYLLLYYAKKNEFGFFGLDLYVCFLANGCFIVHHLKKGSGFHPPSDEYHVSALFDSLVLIPIIGAIAYIFWHLVFLVLDMFFNFSFYFMYLLRIY